MDVDLQPSEYIQSLASSADAALRPLLERMAVLHQQKSAATLRPPGPLYIRTGPLITTIGLQAVVSTY